MIDRRTFLAAALASACSPPANEDPKVGEAGKLKVDEAGEKQMGQRLEAIRAMLGAGARLGLAAIDTGSGMRLLHDPGGRYSMASTFKLPLAGAVLAQVDRGAIKLDDELPLEPGAPLPNSPVWEENPARGRLAVDKLCAAIVQRSDNSAANLLLRRIGGPEALTRFFRACGDEVTRLDRYEMELNSNVEGDPRDTTSPLAIAELVRKLVLGDVLKPGSRSLLAGWMKTSVPGADRLRAGLPRDWRFGHKTGTGARGALNDIGIAWPPKRAPIVIACYLSGGDAPADVRASAHASVARLVAERFA